MVAIDLSRCPCGRPGVFDECCGRYHAGLAAPDPESLMRSRYSAYVVGELAYLMNTVAPERRHLHDLAEIAAWSAGAQWQGNVRGQRLGLQVQHAVAKGDQGQVKYLVYFAENGQPQQMHEHAEFIRRDGRWYYFGPHGRA